MIKSVLPNLATLDNLHAPFGITPPDLAKVTQPGFGLKGSTSLHCRWIGTFA